jgi:cell division protein FtsL
MGIVVMQVSLLKLNTGIGRAVNATSTLERKNSALRLSVSRLSSGERIQRVAERLGMVMPQPDNVQYLTVRGDRDARSAVMNMRVPNADGQQLAAITTQPTLAPATTDPIAPSRDPQPILPQTQGQEGTQGTPADPGTVPANGTAPATGTTPGTGGTTTTTTTQQQQTAPSTSGGATLAPPVGG